jgi:hypothetical protein
VRSAYTPFGRMAFLGTNQKRQHSAMRNITHRLFYASGNRFGNEKSGNFLALLPKRLRRAHFSERQIRVLPLFSLMATR